jgi:hypothetical protein
MTFGRAQLADQVGRDESKVLLVTGDSGVGKSTVLSLSSVARSGWISSQPVVLYHSTGALRESALTALASVLARFVEEGIDGPTLGERLVETIRRLGSEPATAVGRVALAEIVAVLRGKVGDDVGRAVTEYVGELVPDTAASLLARVAESQQPLAAQVISAFAETACQLAPGVRLGLPFDQGERLSNEDLRLLSDLALALPERVHVRVSYATDDVGRRKAVTAIRAGCPQIGEIEVPPLNESAVAAWLTAEGLPSEIAVAVLAQTDGYPLLIDAAMAALRRGEQLGDIPRNEQLAARTRHSWESLSPDAAAVARSLAVLRDPLPEADLRQLTGIDDIGRWATIVSELQHARIFTGDIDGQPWFHEERRRFILEECLTPAQRDEVASNAAQLAWSFIESTTNLRAIGRFAELVPVATSLQETNPRLRSLLELTPQELAMAASLLEIGTTEVGFVAEAGPLAQHALHFIDDIEDPAGALERMVALEVVEATRYQDITLVGAYFAPQEQALIQGRSAVELRRFPVPRVIELVFHSSLREHLGDFESVGFGIGTPSIAQLGRMASTQPGRGRYVDRRNIGPKLLLRGLVREGLQFWSAASYTTEDARLQAVGRLEGLAVETPVGELVVRDLHLHPSRIVPSQRFVQALERACGEGRRSSIGNAIDLPLPDGLSDGEIAEGRIAAAQWMRGRLTDVERIAFGLDRGYLLAWDATDDLWSEYEIQTDGDRQIQSDVIRTIALDAPFDGLTLRRAVDLSLADTIGTRRFRAGGNSRLEPIAAEISHRSASAIEFNSVQPKLRIPFEEDALQPLVEEAFLRELDDARALQRELPLSIRGKEIGPRALWLVVTVPSRTPSGVLSDFVRTDHCEGPSPTGRDAAFVRVIRADNQASRADAYMDPLSAAFPEAVRETSTRAVFEGALAEVLGYRTEDVEVPCFRPSA